MWRCDRAFLVLGVVTASSCQLVAGLGDKSIAQNDASAGVGGSAGQQIDAPNGGKGGSGGSGASDGSGGVPVDFVSARQFGGADDQDLQGLIAFHPSGDIGMLGRFHGELDFGDVPPLTAAKEPGWFVARLDPTMKARWAKHIITGPPPDEPILIAEGTGERTLLAGVTVGTVQIDTGLAAGDLGGNVFVASIGTDGQLEFLKAYGGPLDQHVSAIAAGLSEIRIAGEFQGPLAFGGTTPSFYPDGYRPYVATLDASGDGHWARMFEGCPTLRIHALVSTQAGSTVFAGSYTGDCDLEDGVLAPHVDIAAHDCLMAELDPQGIAIWAVAAGATDCTPRGLSETSVGTLIMSGEIRGSSTWNDGGAADADVFVLESSGANKPYFAKVITRPGFDRATSLAVDPKAGGIFSSALSESGLLAFELDSSGDGPIWIKEVGVPIPFVEPGPRLALDDSGNVLVAGTLLGSTDFGGGPMQPQGKDIFLVEYRP